MSSDIPRRREEIVFANQETILSFAGAAPEVLGVPLPPAVPAPRNEFAQGREQQGCAGCAARYFLSTPGTLTPFSLALDRVGLANLVTPNYFAL